MHALQFVTSNNIMLIYIRVSLHDLLFILKAQLYFLLFFPPITFSLALEQK